MEEHIFANKVAIYVFCNYYIEIQVLDRDQSYARKAMPRIN